MYSETLNHASGRDLVFNRTSPALRCQGLPACLSPGEYPYRQVQHGVKKLHHLFHGVCFQHKISLVSRRVYINAVDFDSDFFG
jgi:hypothetical protein